MADYVLVDPDSTLSFEHDWVTDGYLATGETIVSRQWSISPMNEGTPTSPSLIGSTTSVVFVSGCQAGKVYKLVERITTSVGNIDDRTIVLRCDHS